MTEKVYVTVDSQPKLQEMIDYIKQHDILAYDTETTSLNPRKGQIIGFSVTGPIGTGYYLPTKAFINNELQQLTINDILADDIAKRVLPLLKGKKLIMHNASFDVRFTKCYYGIDLLEDLYCDTMLLVHTINEEGYNNQFGLKAIAKAVQKELGLNVEEEANKEQIELKESIRKNGGSTTKDNYEIWKADLDILSKYAAADTDLTMRLFIYFSTILEQEGLIDFFYNDEVMPLYKEVTIPMEEKGVKLDVETIKQTHHELTGLMKEYHDKVMQELLSIDKVRLWIIDKAVQAYPPNNKGSFAQALAAHEQLPLPQSDKTGKYQITVSNVARIPDSPVKEFLIYGDDIVLDRDLSLKISMQLWKEDMDGYFFNLQSKDHMGEIAFDVLGLKPLSTTKTGKPQFDEDMVQSISDKHSWAKNLRIYNKLLKIRSTYVERFLDNQEDGRYYFSYKQHGTVSGRYGSDAQQLPRPKEEGEDDPIIIEYTNRVRAFFVSDTGNIFIDNDYESLEPHVFAHVSGDEGLKDIFRNGWDFYSTIAIKTEKLDQYSPDKKADNYLKKIAPQLRNKAKAYSLGIPYGMGAYALGMTLGISTKQAQVLIDGYLDGFPNLKKWMNESREMAKTMGYVKSQVGRIRHLSKVKHIYDTIGDGILDWQLKKMLEKQYGMEKVRGIYLDYKNGLNNSINVQIQGLSASIVNRAAIAINRKLKQAGIIGWVCAQIHDQIITEVEESRAEEAAKLVQDAMENTTKISLQLKAPPAISHNWKDGH
jgi:DNA polymerase I-like protein with 3'-5' exonuclease and polymerase domains